ncbi:MAG: hypothetical protein QXI12_07600 [Candidatus Methanomethyliaceae archaeon]
MTKRRHPKSKCMQLSGRGAMVILENGCELNFNSIRSENTSLVKILRDCTKSLWEDAKKLKSRVIKMVTILELDLEFLRCSL